MPKPARRPAISIVLGLFATIIAILPATMGGAQSPHPYRITVPLIASDSGLATGVGPADSQAAELVADVTGATTEDARLAALYRVFDALHLGVYNADGTPIVSGGEKSAQDFYFYQAEIQAMAASLERRDRWSFDDLAGLLNGSNDLSAQITAGQLQTVVAETVSDAAAHPSDTSWLLPLLVQHLGEKHDPPTDLTAASDTSAPVLDALQRSLIVSDLLIALPRSSSATVTAHSNLAADSGGILRQSLVAQQSNCGSFNGAVNARKVGRFAAGFGKVIGKAIQLVAAPIDLFHGVNLAYSVKVKALADNLKTHFGHENPGQPLQFPVLVWMQDKLTQAEINCGWLAGLTFPKQGPIPNIKIQWDTGDLESLGTITCGVAPVACQETGDDGIATLQFQPKQEQAPYTGHLTSEKGRVEANALYLSSLGNMFGAANEVATPKTVDMLWEVEWHAKGAWEGQINMTWTGGNTSAHGTTDVRFELGLPAPGEGDVHTNVYQLTKAVMNWSETGTACMNRSDTTDLLPADTTLTVTESNGSMVYRFDNSPFKLVMVTWHCDESALFENAIPPQFWFPQPDPSLRSYTSGTMPAGDVITGSASYSYAGVTQNWSWTLTRK